MVTIAMPKRGSQTREKATGRAVRYMPFPIEDLERFFAVLTRCHNELGIVIKEAKDAGITEVRIDGQGKLDTVRDLLASAVAQAGADIRRKSLEQG